MSSWCGYCSNQKSEGWHDCKRAVAAKAKLGKVLVNIDDMVRGGQAVWGSKEDVAAYRNMKTHIRAAGKEVQEGWWDKSYDPLQYHINSQER